MNTSNIPKTHPAKPAVSKTCFTLFRCLLLATCFALCQNASATLFFTEHFDYPGAVNLGATASPWNTTTAGGGDNNAQLRVTNTAALTSPSGFAAASGNGVEVAPAASQKKNIAAFNGATGIPVADGNVVYASYLLNVQTLPTVANGFAIVAGLHNNANPAWALQVCITNSGQIGVSKRSTTAFTFAPGTPVSSPGTHLVVMRYTFQPGADEVALWVDPTEYEAVSAPEPSAFTATGSDMANTISNILIFSPNLAAGPKWWIDEMRVGTTWADVMPSSGGCTPPTIGTQPTAQTNCAGQQVQFSVAATGTVLTYQWRKYGTNLTNGGNISGATNATLTINPIGAGDAAAAGAGYDCVVTESGTCPSTSIRVALAVNTAPAITDEPDNVGLSAGATANFALTATGGSLSYQWEVSTDIGANWSPVSTGTGGTSNSYTTAITTTNDNGNQYRCIVTGVCSPTSVTSVVATLTVTCSPAGITSSPSSGAVPEGTAASFAVAATGSSPSYQWELSTDGGTFWNPVGSSAASYTTPATISTDNGNKYRCIVSVACDPSSVTSAVATLTIVGSSASFRSAASGRWQDNSTWELSGDGGATWFPAGLTPTSANATNILISNGTTVAITNSDTTVDETVVAAGGTLTIASNKKLIVAEGTGTDLTVFGTVENVSTSGSALTLNDNATMVVESGGLLVENGPSTGWVSAGTGSTITFAADGKFQLMLPNGRVPIATWDPASTCEIAYAADGSRPNTAYLSQEFGNFTVNCPAQTSTFDFGGTLTNVLGDLNVTMGANPGSVELRLLTSSATNGTLKIGGNINVNSGKLNFASSGGPWTITLTSNLFIAAGASIDVSGSSATNYTLILNGGGIQNYTCNGDNNATKLNWIVNSGSTLNLNSDLTVAVNSGSVPGKVFTANGTVNVNGHTLSADVVDGSGTIRNQNSGNGVLVIGTSNKTNTLDGSLTLSDGAGGGTLALVKAGNSGSSGLLTITAPHTFSGGLTVSNGFCYVNNASGSGTGSGAVTVVDGTLGGTGIIAGSVNVNSAGNLAPGASIDDLTISGVLTLGGTFTAEVNTGAVPNTDQAVGTSAVTYGGTLEIVNQGAALTTSDTFQIFPAGTRTSAFGAIVPANPNDNVSLAWDTSTLTTDGTLRISTVAVGPDTTPTNIVSSVSGGNLTLTWPSSHIGWTLQTQTNSRSVGLNLATNTWFDVSDSTTTNLMVIPISSGNPTVFYRLRLVVP